MTVTPIERAAPDGRRRRRQGADVAEEARRIHRTDVGNATRLVRRYGRDLLYLRGQWYVWDGTRFRIDETGAVERLAKETVRAIWSEAAEIAADGGDTKEAAALTKHALSSESRQRITAMISLAGSELDVVVDQADDLDANPMLLTCTNGTLDLHSGTLRAHDRADRITRCTGIAYEPAPTPAWDGFLTRILPDPGIREYFQRIIGYTLTGSTSEEKLFLLNGTGQNGKSTLIDVMCRLMGEYAMPAPPELLLSRQRGAPSNDVAATRGARLASVSETEEGAQLDEVRTKALVTGDRQSARFLHKEFFTFKPTAKYWIATNHRPIIRGADKAIWRRMVLVPFEAAITDEEKDKDLGVKLAAELPGILAWAVRGCLNWQRDGLTPPPAIVDATNGYRAEQDLIGSFLTAECVVHPKAKVTAAALYATYRRWCDDAGENPQTQRRFGQRLSERPGLTKDKDGHANLTTWFGVGLRAGGEWDHLAADAAPVEEDGDAADQDAAEEEPGGAAPTRGSESEPAPAAGSCSTCSAPGLSCGPGGVADDGETLPCVLCAGPTLVRSRCGAARHGQCRPDPDAGPPAPVDDPPPLATAPAPEANGAAPRPPAGAASRRSTNAAARKDAKSTVADEFRAALAEGRDLMFLSALEGAFEPRRRVEGRMMRPFWRPELPGCTYAVHAVEAWGWQRPYEGPAVVLDRSAAFLSAASSVLVAHGALEHTGPLDTFDDRRPGYYEVQVHPWYESDALPHPLLHTEKRPSAWVTAPTVALLRDLEREGRWPDVTILNSYTADGVRIDEWARFVNTIRAEAITEYGRDSEQYAEVKDRYSMAFQLMLGSADDGGRRRWKCGAQRPDWTQTVRAQAAANLYRWADACRKVAPDAPPIALRNTDELVIPADALDVVTTADRPGGLRPMVIDPDGIKLGSFKVKHLDEWKGGK